MEITTTVESSFSDYGFSTLWIEEQLRGRVSALPNPDAVSDEAIERAVNIAYEMTIGRDVSLLRFKVSEIAFFQLKTALTMELSPVEGELMFKYMKEVSEAPILVDTDGDGIADTSVSSVVLTAIREKKF